MTATAAHESLTVESTLPLESIQDAAATVFADSPVFLAYVFGSRVWGVPRADSDLDIGYYVLPHTDFPCLDLAAELRLAGSLSDALGLEVDLRCLNNAPLAMRGRVLEKGRRIYCSNEVARVNLERDLLGRYLDYKPKLDALRELRFAALAAKSESPR